MQAIAAIRTRADLDVSMGGAVVAQAIEAAITDGPATLAALIAAVGLLTGDEPRQTAALDQIVRAVAGTSPAAKKARYLDEQRALRARKADKWR